MLVYANISQNSCCRYDEAELPSRSLGLFQHLRRKLGTMARAGVNGSSPEKNLPDKWSKTENIAWSLDMPGPSAATPAVWGDNVFVSSTDMNGAALVAMCVDRKTGKVLW